MHIKHQRKRPSQLGGSDLGECKIYFSATWLRGRKSIWFSVPGMANIQDVVMICWGVHQSSECWMHHVLGCPCRMQNLQSSPAWWQPGLVQDKHGLHLPNCYADTDDALVDFHSNHYDLWIFMARYLKLMIRSDIYTETLHIGGVDHLSELRSKLSIALYLILGPGGLTKRSCRRWDDMSQAGHVGVRWKWSFLEGDGGTQFGSWTDPFFCKRTPGATEVLKEEAAGGGGSVHQLGPSIPVFCQLGGNAGPKVIDPQTQRLARKQQKPWKTRRCGLSNCNGNHMGIFTTIYNNQCCNDND